MHCFPMTENRVSHRPFVLFVCRHNTGRSQMAEDGIDISQARPKLIDPLLAERADRIVTMGCDVRGVPRIDADWGLPDPKGHAAEHIREIRDSVKVKARALADQLMN
jgi:arsenate reductase (thioredoxin)